MNITTKSIWAAAGAAVMVACAPAPGANPQGGVTRTDTTVASDTGVDVGVRAVTSEQADGVPVILLHGARVPGIASFDLPVPGYSLAEDLAEDGHPTYVMDARGYGTSTRPAQMDGDPKAGVPLVRSNEVVTDVGAVVDHVQQESGAERVALVGWATGGHWAGMYAAANPGDVSHLVLYNSLYGATDGHPTLGRGGDNEDADVPGAFNRSAGSFRLSEGPSLLTQWDNTIPADDPATWRDPAVAEAYQREALASDPTSADREPPSFRAPNGATEDSFYLATGRQLWDASLIEADTLILRSELDFWSRPEDVTALQQHLVRSGTVRAVTLSQATHFAHLDRPERGRDQFVGEVLGFL